MQLHSRRKAKLNHSGFGNNDDVTTNGDGMGAAQGYSSSLIGNNGVLNESTVGESVVVWDVLGFRVVGFGFWALGL